MGGKPRIKSMAEFKELFFPADAERDRLAKMTPAEIAKERLDKIFEAALHDEELIEATRQGYEDIAHGRVMTLDEVTEKLKDDREAD